MLAQKRRVRVTLDIECYDDLDLKSFEWNDILGLEGDEDIIDINMRRRFQLVMCQYIYWHKCQMGGVWVSELSALF